MWQGPSLKERGNIPRGSFWGCFLCSELLSDRITELPNWDLCRQSVSRSIRCLYPLYLTPLSKLCGCASGIHTVTLLTDTSRGLTDSEKLERRLSFTYIKLENLYNGHICPGKWHWFLSCSLMVLVIETLRAGFISWHAAPQRSRRRRTADL